MITRRCFIALSSLLAIPSTALAQSATGNGERTSPRPKVLLVPLGSGLSDGEVAFVKSSLLAFYDFELLDGQRFSMPKGAYYAPRKRHRAEKLLDYLDELAPSSITRVVGITASDISTTKGSLYDFGILGLATIDGRACVLSSFRCARGTRTREQALHRFGKVAVHEVGHTLGLMHCPTVGCLMEDARGSVLTADREYDLCSDCRARLEATGRAARTSPVIPWPKPRA
jgi:archaemetzincin